MIARLDDYARSVGTKESASPPPSGELLPDVNTMTQRLAARLKTTPADIKGWRMLGWSYFHTAHYKEAAAAYARAVELDPSSDELKRSYEEAKAKASASDNSKSVSTGPPRMHDNGGDPSSVGKTARSEATPASEQDVAIRAMVDGLANRLENAPRDVEGWTRLMRSRVVLGEREVATSALRKALKVFKDDTTASEKIMAAAVELDLKAE
ncbi:MAG: tetratricopeptide repeat protein [Hyphomicrobiaceae bacterium]